MTLICVFCGCICVTTTIVLLIATLWDRTVTPYAKWVGFVAGMSKVKVQTKCIAIHTCNHFHFFHPVIFFCMAAVTFPIGFSQEAIGGAPYQLANSYQVAIFVCLNRLIFPFTTGGHLLHFLCDGLVDDSHLRALCKQSVSTTLLDASSLST